MHRIATYCVFGIVAGLGWLAIAAAQTTKVRIAEPAQPAKEVDKKELPSKQVPDVDYVAVLSQRVNISSINDPKVPLDDVLKLLSAKYNLTFDINARAFANEGLKDADQCLIAEKEIPPANNVRLETALRRVLARVPSTSGATFLVRSDVIEITTNQFAEAEIWGKEYDGPHLPLVYLRADKVPLNEVLMQLADQSSLNIMYGGAGDKAATPITVRFTNVPVDTAVRLLAAQAGLGFVHRDNMLLLTTEEKAAALNLRFAEENPDPDGKKYFRRGGSRPVVVIPGM
jgi:hypothetical protein